MIGIVVVSHSAMLAAGLKALADQLGKMLSDGVEGIVSRGRAEPGDKTMCDAWWPALAAL